LRRQNSSHGIVSLDAVLHNSVAVDAKIQNHHITTPRREIVLVLADEDIQTSIRVQVNRASRCKKSEGPRSGFVQCHEDQKRSVVGE